MLIIFIRNVRIERIIRHIEHTLVLASLTYTYYEFTAALYILYAVKTPKRLDIRVSEIQSSNLRNQ